VDTVETISVKSINSNSAEHKLTSDDINNTVYNNMVEQGDYLSMLSIISDPFNIPDTKINNFVEYISDLFSKTYYLLGINDTFKNDLPDLEKHLNSINSDYRQNTSYNKQAMEYVESNIVIEK
jgi:cytochrome c